MLVAPATSSPGLIADVIVRAINKASALVLVLSADAIRLDHVAREMSVPPRRTGRASHSHRCHAVESGLEYLLSNWQ